MRTRSDGRIRWWLVPLTWVWACCHGTWLFGPALAVLFAVGLYGPAHRPTRPACEPCCWRRCPCSPALSLQSARDCFSPRSPSGTSAPFIAEWRPAALTEPSLLACVAMLVVVALVWLRSARKVSVTDLLLWAVALASAVLYARTIAVGAILATPLLAGPLSPCSPPEPPHDTPSGGSWPSGQRQCSSLVGLAVPRTASAAGGVPARLDATLARIPEGTVVYNVDALGGWLWYAHPNVKPTMDTRAEIYGPDYVGAYVDAISGLSGMARDGVRYWSTVRAARRR